MRGDGQIYSRPGSPYLWITFYDPAARKVRESTRILADAPDAKNRAEKYLRRRRREVENAKDGGAEFVGPARRRVTMKEALEALERDFKRREIKGLAQSLSHINVLKIAFEGDRALGVTEKRVHEFIEEQQALGRKPATINRKVELVKQALRHSKFPVPDVGKLRENNARQGFFEKAEFEKLVAALEEPFDDLARLGYLTGWREGELLALEWRFIDRGAGEINLPDSKNGRPRKIGMSPSLAEIIARRWAARAYTERTGTEAISPYVFHIEGARVLPRRLQKAWKAACKRAGLPGKLFHDLRRTAARDMVRAGVSTTVAKRITGHVTDSMFERYNIVATADTLEALRLREKALSEAPEKSNLEPFPEKNGHRTGTKSN